MMFFFFWVVFTCLVLLSDVFSVEVTYFVNVQEDITTNSCVADSQDPSFSCSLRSAWTACNQISNGSTCNIMFNVNYVDFLSSSNSLELSPNVNIVVNGPGVVVTCTGCSTSSSTSTESISGFPVSTGDLTNTNSATQNSMYYYFNVCPGNTVTFSSCDNYIGDTYFILYDSNFIPVAVNDDSCGRGSYISYVVAGTSCSTYVLAVGCYSSTTCSATVTGLITSSEESGTPFIEYDPGVALPYQTPSLTVRGLYMAHMSGVIQTFSPLHLTVEDCTLYNSSSTSSAPIYFNQLLSTSSVNITGTKFISGQGLTGGGISVLNSTSPIWISNCRFEESYASSGGGIFLSSASNVTLDSNIFLRTSAIDGGAIFIDSSKNIILRDVAVESSTATNGASIMVNTFSSKISIESSEFVSCESSAVGGAVMIGSSNEDILITNTVIRNSSAANYGGGVYIGSANSLVNLVNMTVEYNNALASGGAVYIDSENTDISFIQSVLQNNYAGESGGAIYINEDNSNINLVGTQLISNRATNRGGGMEVYQNNYRIVSTDVESNSVSYSVHFQPVGSDATFTYSFAVPASSSAVVISFDRMSTIDQVGYTGQAQVTITLGSTTLLSTRLDSFPGVHYPSLYVPISNGASTITIEYTMPTSNAAGYKPYGIVVYADIVLSDYSSPTIFQNNSADVGSGGGLFSYYSNTFISLLNTHFLDNRAVGTSGYGGGAYFWLVNNGLLLVGSHFMNNRAFISGGGLALISANAGGAIYGCNFSSNVVLSDAGVGGSIYASNSNGQGSFTTQNPIVISSTYLGNSSASYGGGLGLESRNVLTLTEVSMVLNKAISGGGMYCQSSNVVTFFNSTVSDNAVDVNGGGVFLEEQNQVNISLSSFLKNTAELGGGMAIATNSEVQFSQRNAFSFNFASFGGGAIYLSSTTLWTMSRQRSDTAYPELTFSSNAAIFGSAIYFFKLSQVATSSLTNATFDYNGAAGGGTIYWVYDPSSMTSPPPITTASVAFANNNIGYGEIATQAVRLIAPATYSVLAYQTVLNPPLSVYALDYYNQHVTIDPGTVYSITAEAPTSSVNCTPSQPALTSETPAFVMENGYVNFTGVNVYCYPKGSMMVTFESVSNTGIPSELSSFYLGTSTSSILKFRACEVGEKLVNGDCVACPNGTYTFDAGVLQCTSCISSTGMENCYSNNIFVSAGYWRRTANTETILECPLGSQSCRGGWTTGESMCEEGYTGPKCSVCSKGYYSSDGACVACNSSGQVRMTSLVVIIIVIVLCLIYYFYRVYRFVNYTIEHTTNELKRVAELQAQIARNEIDADSIKPEDLEIHISSTEFLCLWLRKKVQDIMVKVKILTATMQVITTCAVVFSVSFPSSFNRFTNAFQFFNLNVYSVLPLGCGDDTFDFMATLLWSTMGPILVMFAVVVYLAQLHVKKQKGLITEDVWQTWRSRGMSVYFYLSYLVLPSVSVTIFQTFICENIDPQGEDPNTDDRFLSADMSISCSSAYYKAWAGYAIFMIFVYPIGIPLSYLVMLYRNRYEISTREEKELPDKAEFFGVAGAFRHYGGLIVEYMTGIESEATKRKKQQLEELQKEARIRSSTESEEVGSMSFSGANSPLGRPLSSDSPRRGTDSIGSPRSSDTGLLSISVRSRKGSKKHTSISATSLGLEVDMGRQLSERAAGLSFLWAAYEPQYWYWDVVEASRRIILTAVLSVIAPGTSSQNVLALLVSLLFIKLYGYYKPYVNDEDDTLAELGQFQIFFTYLAAMTQQNDLLPPVYDNLVGGLLVLINILLPCIALYFEVQGYYAEKEKQESLTGEFTDKSAHNGDSSDVSCCETLGDMWTLLVTNFLFGNEESKQQASHQKVTQIEEAGGDDNMDKDVGQGITLQDIQLTREEEGQDLELKDDSSSESASPVSDTVPLMVPDGEEVDNNQEVFVVTENEEAKGDTEAPFDQV